MNCEQAVILQMKENFFFSEKSYPPSKKSSETNFSAKVRWNKLLLFVFQSIEIKSIQQVSDSKLEND